MTRSNGGVSHPAAGCTKAQVAAFERIACGDDTMLNPRTADALVAKGLIYDYKQLQMPRGKPRVFVKRYDLPLPVHIRWCKWCSENVADGDE